MEKKNVTMYKLSFPDSKKMLDELMKKEHAIEDLIYDGHFHHRKQAVEAVNKLLIDTAEKTGMSLYDLCFRTIPDFSYPKIDFKDQNTLNPNFSFETEIRLIPVEFDLTHDGGYWKEKYYNLKRKMQELIDSKEE